MAGYPPPVGFNVNPEQPGSYPPQGPMGYPPSGGQPGYPPQGPMGYPGPGGQFGYPPQGPTGYPGPGGPSGYPPQGPMGYPGPGGQSGYPPQGPMGYPGPGGQSGFSPQGQMGYPPSGAQSSFGGPANAIGYGGGGGGGAYSGSGGFGGGMGSSSAYYRGRPTVVPSANFDPGKDAEDLRQAMRGLGTDEGRIISILSKRSFDQRVEIARKYMASFGKDLGKHLKSELSGKFEDLVLYSMDSLDGMLAATIYKAIDGAGTNERLLIQALVPYPNAVVRATVCAYQTKFGRDVVKDVRGDTSGDFEKILVALLQAQREENAPVDMGRVAADAEALYKAGEKRLGTEEAVFTRILTQRSFEQIRAISTCYQQKYGNTLQKAIKKETSGYYKETMLAIVAFAEDKNGLLAEWLYNSMAGLGTSDTSLMQLVLGRSEIDLQDVKEAYQRKYNKSLVKAIEGDTSGDYKRMLVALVGP